MTKGQLTQQARAMKPPLSHLTRRIMNEIFRRQLEGYDSVLLSRFLVARPGLGVLGPLKGDLMRCLKLEGWISKPGQRITISIETLPR